MHPTKACALFFLTASHFAIASSDNSSDCLKHLGGGYGDTQCYQALSAKFTEENENIYKEIAKSIPPGSSHARLLDEYMASQKESERFCDLQRDAGSKWKKSNDGTMYPAIYENCIYKLREFQNSFLKDLLDMSQW
ncbi:hypothetical protein [Ralstonia sp. UBA689]|uniref:hypothetical protein n=1 Tax=Ralstonia sp. UBA689 TaxID=1947373 RepID=UPI0025F89B8E|nr:hypothetical protein [Ralstonia sp. UBA689]